MGICVGEISVRRRAKYARENAYLSTSTFLAFDSKSDVKISTTNHFATFKCG